MAEKRQPHRLSAIHVKVDQALKDLFAATAGSHGVTDSGLLRAVTLGAISEGLVSRLIEAGESHPMMPSSLLSARPQKVHWERIPGSLSEKTRSFAYSRGIYRLHREVDGWYLTGGRPGEIPEPLFICPRVRESQRLADDRIRQWDRLANEAKALITKEATS